MFMTMAVMLRILILSAAHINNACVSGLSVSTLWSIHKRAGTAETCIQNGARAAMPLAAVSKLQHFCFMYSDILLFCVGIESGM
jgi:hypothetical protein